MATTLQIKKKKQNNRVSRTTAVSWVSNSWTPGKEEEQWAKNIEQTTNTIVPKTNDALGGWKPGQGRRPR